MEGNGHRNQVKQKEVAGCSEQGSEGLLSVLCVISPRKIRLEVNIQLINNLTSFLIKQNYFRNKFFLLHVEGKLNFHHLPLCGPDPPQYVTHVCFRNFIVFLKTSPITVCNLEHLEVFLLVFLLQVFPECVKMS